MVETANSLEDLKAVTSGEGAEVAAAIVAEPKIDDLGRSYATGRRKEATARVWIKPGSGKIIINGKDQEQYFARPVLRMVIEQPLIESDRRTQFDVIATVKGSGLSGQAGA
ncbi:MAG: 30S ribosomal protein S9, partial [Henriciella sp.]